LKHSCDNLPHSKRWRLRVNSSPSKLFTNSQMINKSLFSQLLIAGTLCSFSVSSVQAHSYGIGNAKSYSGGGASSHAPIGVMGDHMHKKGEYMFSYRFSHGQMNGSRIGNNQFGSRSFAHG
jgi:hypothetical protein